MAEIYGGRLSVGGTPTTLTNAATTGTGLGPYQITDSTKRVIDPGTGVVIKDNGSTVPLSNLASFNYLFGEVTFASGHAPTGPVTISGKYIPLIQVLYSASVDAKIGRQKYDATRLSDDFIRSVAGKVEIEATLKTTEPFITDIGDGRTLTDLLNEKTPVLVDVGFDSTDTHALRFWGIVAGDASLDLKPADIQRGTLTFAGQPQETQEGMVILYSWR